MENNKFFKYTWRFNALLISIAGLLAVGLLMFAGYKLFRDVTRERNIQNIVNVESSDNIKQAWRFGQLLEVHGSPYVLLPLNSDQRYAQSYYGKSSLSARNYLFINTLNSQKKWLFKQNDYLIQHIEMLSHENYGEKNKKELAILLKIIKSDSNSDALLTDSDLKTLALVQPDGTNYTEVIDNVDLYIGSKLTTEDSLLVLFERNGIGYSANVNLSDFVVESETELPKVGF